MGYVITDLPSKVNLKRGGALDITYKNKRIEKVCTHAMDLVHPYRLVFEEKWTEIQIANILEIVDYH